MQSYIETPEREIETGLEFAQGFIEAVHGDLNDIKHSFFRIGFRLHEAAQFGYYSQLGYDNIAELAEAEFGFKKSTTYELIQIYKYARDERQPMQIAAEYDKYSKTQLREMSRQRYGSSGDFLKIVKPEDTVENIRKFVTEWNKYAEKHSGTPKCKSVTEFLQTCEASEEREPEAIPGQLPGQMLIEFPEPDAGEPEPDEERPEQSAYAESPAIDPPAVMTDGELIKYCLKLEPYGNAKFKIYDKFFAPEPPGKEEFKEYIKEVYGNFGIGGALAGNRFKFMSSNPQTGFVIERNDGGRIILSWSVVAGRIKKLLLSLEYLTQEEYARYKQWKKDRESLPAAVLTADELQESEESEPIAIESRLNSAYAENLKPEAPEAPEAPKEVIKQTNREHLQGLTNEEFARVVCEEIAAIQRKWNTDSATIVKTAFELWLDGVTA